MKKYGIISLADDPITLAANILAEEYFKRKWREPSSIELYRGYVQLEKYDAEDYTVIIAPTYQNIKWKIYTFDFDSNTIKEVEKEIPNAIPFTQFLKGILKFSDKELNIIGILRVKNYFSKEIERINKIEEKVKEKLPQYKSKLEEVKNKLKDIREGTTASKYPDIQEILKKYQIVQSLYGDILKKIKELGNSIDETLKEYKSELKSLIEVLKEGKKKVKNYFSEKYTETVSKSLGEIKDILQLLRNNLLLLKDLVSSSYEDIYNTRKGILNQRLQRLISVGNEASERIETTFKNLYNLLIDQLDKSISDTLKNNPITINETLLQDYLLTKHKIAYLQSLLQIAEEITEEMIPEFSKMKNSLETINKKVEDMTKMSITYPIEKVLGEVKEKTKRDVEEIGKITLVALKNINLEEEKKIDEEIEEIEKRKIEKVKEIDKHIDNSLQTLDAMLVSLNQLEKNFVENVYKDIEDLLPPPSLEELESYPQKLSERRKKQLEEIDSIENKIKQIENEIKNKIGKLKKEESQIEGTIEEMEKYLDTKPKFSTSTNVEKIDVENLYLEVLLEENLVTGEIKIYLPYYSRKQIKKSGLFYKYISPYTHKPISISPKSLEKIIDKNNAKKISKPEIERELNNLVKLKIIKNKHKDKILSLLRD